jgi:hypothetical protein
MTNYFCQTCGTLSTYPGPLLPLSLYLLLCAVSSTVTSNNPAVYRVGAAFPNRSILRLGTVDDFNLVETKLKPTRELFVKDRVSWFKGVDGEKVERWDAMPQVLSKKWEGIPQASNKRSEKSEDKL